MNVGDKIQALRTKNGMSQEALAHRLGVTRQSVSKWELGQTLPDTEKIVQLSQLFRVTIDSLLLDESPVTDSPAPKRHFAMYLIVKDFAKSVAFYEKLLETYTTVLGKNRFAKLFFDGVCIAIMNEAHLPGHDTAGSGDHKFAFNFWVPDLAAEYKRVRRLDIGRTTAITCAGGNYHFFNIYDPDGNVIEMTGNYKPRERRCKHANDN